MTETVIILDTIRFITGITVLLNAPYADIKTRRAPNILWILMGLIGAILLVVQYFTAGFQNLFYLLFIPIMINLVYALFYISLIFDKTDLRHFNKTILN